MKRRLKNLECIYFDTKFSVEIYANFRVICPCCKRSIYFECDYGFRPVTPCQIYLGEEIVGVVEESNIIYKDYLKMDNLTINLSNTYLEAIYEAEEVVKKRLNIFRPSEKLPIIPRGGNLCFYFDC